MDKEASSTLVRSPLGSIVNQSHPTSEDQSVPEDDIYNASICGSEHSEQETDGTFVTIPNEYAYENNPPPLVTAQEFHLDQLHRILKEIEIRSRSQSMDVHQPTQLDTIVEVSTKASSHPDLRPQRSQSLDERKLRMEVLSSTSSDGYICLPLVKQYPKSPIVEPPRRQSTPPNLPRFNTQQAADYQIPAPPQGLRDSLSERMTPERELWNKQSSRLPPGAIMRAEDGSLVRGIWHAPRSDHTGNSQRGLYPIGDPFARSVARTRYTETHRVDLEAGLHGLAAHTRAREGRVKRW